MNLDAALDYVDRMKSICPEAREEVKELLTFLVSGPLKEPEQSAFKVGDAVEVISDISDAPEVTGWVGRVAVAGTESGPNQAVGIEFTKRMPIGLGHTLGGRVQDGHGWWIRARYLKVVN